MSSEQTARKKPLEGIRVIELGQLLAGPFTGSMLAYFGAEVIKVESPEGGDPIRGWREVQDGTSLWWHSLGRNKKSVTIDLKTEGGRDLVRQLLQDADVLIENFRPGVMEKWGLGPDDIKPTNPGIIYTRISGYGQDGPNANKPGFASVCEGYSGFRFLNGFPDQAPVRPNLSIGDTIAGIHAALGVCLAIIERTNNDKGEGQVIDVALYESMFNLMEAVVPEYDGAGIIRQPSGTTITGIVPTNTFCCADGKYVVIGGNGDSIYQRLMTAAGRQDMAEDPELDDNAKRVVHQQKIEQVLADWCMQHDAAVIIEKLEAERVPVGPIYTVEDMMSDPHYQARGMFEQVEIDGKPLKIPAMLPKLGSTPGQTNWSGPKLGSHNTEVFEQLLGLDTAQLAALKRDGAIG
ncbi:MAG: crotonobetainyl-CoA:carnitine CoA-transferase CaiB-like acyl-CoA transferase [Paraglaciecola psychrophila]|jgi:crotonobetainyl-CoA:carnitine CoA-transferase CaiB-like acyl-CoA transferase